ISSSLFVSIFLRTLWPYVEFSTFFWVTFSFRECGRVAERQDDSSCGGNVARNPQIKSIGTEPSSHDGLRISIPGFVNPYERASCACGTRPLIGRATQCP